MADFSQSLDDPSRGKSMTSGGPAVPEQTSSFIGGLSNLARGLTGALSQRDDYAKSQYELDYQKEQRAATNDAAGSVFEALNAANDTLGRVKNGEAQGVLPQGTTALHLESTVQDLFQRHPDQKAAIQNYLTGNGYNHYLFDNVEQQQKLQEIQDNTEAMAGKVEFDAAVKAGQGQQPGESYDAVRIRGRAVLQANDQLEAGKKAAEATLAAVNLTEKQRTMQMTDANNLTVTGTMALAHTQLDPLINGLNSLVFKATVDPSFTGDLESAVPTIHAAFSSVGAQLLARATAAHAGPTAISDITAQLDTLEKSISGVYTGPASLQASRQRLLENMKTNFGLDNAKAFPLFTQLSEMMGPNNVIPMFGGDPSLSFKPEQIQQLRQQFQKYNTADADQGRVFLNNIRDIVKGNAQFQDLTSDQAKAVFPMVSSVVTSHAKDIAGGNKDPQLAQDYLHNYGKVVNAAASLQGPLVDLPSLKQASDLVSGATQRTALITSLSNAATAEQGQSEMLSSRSAAARLFTLTKTTGPDAVPDKFQSLRFNASTGHYEIFADKAAYDKEVVSEGNMFIDTGGVGAMQMTSLLPPFQTFRTADTTLKTKMDTLNENLDHLVATAKYDPETPKGVTPRQLQDHYVNGTPLPQPEGSKQHSSSKEALDALVKAATDIPIRALENPVSQGTFRISGPTGDKLTTAATSNGVPVDLAHAVASQESGGNQGATSPKGAKGVMQLMPDTAKALGVNASNEDENIQGGTKYLGQLLQMFGGDQKLALMAYNAGPTRVFEWMQKGRPIDDKKYPWQAETLPYVNNILKKVNSG